VADSAIDITPGTGASIDTRTESNNGQHRQVVVLGDPVTGDNVAKVSAAGALLMQGYQSARVAGTITSATSVVGPMDVSNYNIATVTIRGTYAGVNVTFEASDDGTNYFAVLAARTDTFTAASTSGVITANSSWAWDIPVGAFTHLRVRATAWTSGTANVGISAQSMPYEPCPTVGVSGTVTVSSSGTATTTPANVTTTGATLSSAATTNATVMKASAGNLYNVAVSNTGASPAYLKLYNKTTAPTVGTDVPVLTIAIPASGVLVLPFGAQGFRFATGIAYAITGAAADNDTTAVAAAQVKVMWSYI
jgi:hypothetical protein